MESVFYVLAGFVLLILGGELLVKAAVALSLKLRLSRIVIGMTVVSFATSLPELLVSLMAGVKGHPDIALSNVVGSNIANIALVLGLTAVLMPITVKRQTYRFNWPAMMVLTVLLIIFLHTGLRLSRIEGAILLTSLIVFTVFIIRHSYKTGDVKDDEFNEALNNAHPLKVAAWLVFGGVALWGGSELLVNGSVDIARKLHVSERVIGISLIALGTSIPELAASLVSAYRKEKDLSLGNLIGSNIFNIGSVLGITAMIKPIEGFEEKLLHTDVVWMFIISLLVVPLALLPPKHLINWWKASLLVLLYLLFIYQSFSG
ncbi:MAG: calcium/sodium antiporter [Chlorobi bacterium]|nr:calcium/sodium antiporter [Chlorobiota bacterium]